MEKLTISIAETAKALGISKPKVYDLVKSDKNFPAITLGKRIIVPVDGLRRWLDESSGTKQ